MFLTAGLFCSAGVVDRVAVVVGKTVFTEGEVNDEARLTELESGKPLDLSPARRREAAERLVDQQLLRDEIAVTGFTTSSASQADALLRQFRQEHFPSVPLYRAALTRYGVTEEALKEHLSWEVTVLRFTDQRFRPLPPTPEGQSASPPDKAVQPEGESVDQQMEAWLKRRRADTRIVFKQEAFQ